MLDHNKVDFYTDFSSMDSDFIVDFNNETMQINTEIKAMQIIYPDAMLKSVYDTNKNGIVDRAEMDKDGNDIVETYARASDVQIIERLTNSDIEELLK